MKNKELISAVVGSSFFAVPYLALAFPVLPALAIGCAAFGASELVLSEVKVKETLKDTNRSLYLKISKAEKQNKEILNLIPKVDSSEVKNNLKKIYLTVNKILSAIQKNPKKESTLNNFFEYYLPVLIKIVKKYDEIEENGLISSEGKEFIKKADKMIKDTNSAFETILSSLYQNDIMDADADMKVYDLMLKADGIVDNNLLMKGSGSDEK